MSLAQTASGSRHPEIHHDEGLTVLLPDFINGALTVRQITIRDTRSTQAMFGSYRWKNCSGFIGGSTF